MVMITVGNHPLEGEKKIFLRDEYHWGVTDDKERIIDVTLHVNDQVNREPFSLY